MNPFPRANDFPRVQPSLADWLDSVDARHSQSVWAIDVNLIRDKPYVELDLVSCGEIISRFAGYFKIANLGC